MLVRTNPEVALELLGLDRAWSASANDDRRAPVQRRHGDARLTFVRDCFLQQLDNRPEILVQRNLQSDFGNLFQTDDRRVPDRIRGQLLVRDHETRPVVGADERVGQADLLDGAGRVLELDAIAEPDWLCERDQQPGDEVSDRPLRGEPDHDPEHGRRSEQATGDRAHLRNHEER